MTDNTLTLYNAENERLKKQLDIAMKALRHFMEHGYEVTQQAIEDVEKIGGLKIMTDFLNISLPKWPALVVRGEKVTADQAKEIIIRTDGFDFWSNDNSFSKQLNQTVYGVDDSCDMDWQARKTIMDSFGILELNYLSNSRIVSSYLVGPHGWCNWDGYIGCNTYNIGKWPSVEEVFTDWQKIAEAFPFLKLHCQLFNGETCEVGIKPLIEFAVFDGQVQVVEPITILDYPSDDVTRSVFNILNPMREHGCTVEAFREALQTVKRKIASVRG